MRTPIAPNLDRVYVGTFYFPDETPLEKGASKPAKASIKRAQGLEGRVSRRRQTRTRKMGVTTSEFSKKDSSNLSESTGGKGSLSNNSSHDAFESASTSSHGFREFSSLVMVYPNPHPNHFVTHTREVFIMLVHRAFGAQVALHSIPSKRGEASVSGIVEA
jgi:hypothetical protein